MKKQGSNKPRTLSGKWKRTVYVLKSWAKKKPPPKAKGPAQIISREQQDKWLAVIQAILFDCRTTLENWKRIGTPEDRHEVEFMEDHFIRHVCVHYHFVLVVQLAKLFDGKGSHKSSFPKLFNVFTSHHLDPHYTALLEKNREKQRHWYGLHVWTPEQFQPKILELKDRLEDPDTKKLIKKLKDCRDQVAAHADLDQMTADANGNITTIGWPTYHELLKLERLAEDFYGIVRAGLGFPSMDLHIAGRGPFVVMHHWREGRMFRKVGQKLLEQDIDLWRLAEQMKWP